MKIFLIIWLSVKFARSLVYEQIDSQSFRPEDVIYSEDDIPSKIACVHKCLYMQADALFTTGSKCHCVKKERGERSGENGNAVKGSLLKSVGKNNELVLESIHQCSNRSTPLNDYHHGKIAYLDRHRMQCNTGTNEVLSGFTFEKQGDQMRYLYKCCVLTGGCEYKGKETTMVDEQDSLHSLTRHPVQCDNGYLSFVRLERNNKISPVQSKYRFQCCTPRHYNRLSCFERETSPTNVAGKKTEAFVDHPLVCPTSYALGEFKVVITNDQMKYVYTCCNVV